MVKNQANAKQHSEAKLLLFESYSHSSSMLSSKNDRTYFENQAKEQVVCSHEIVRLIVMKMKMKMKNKLQRYNINRRRLRHGH